MKYLRKMRSQNQKTADELEAEKQGLIISDFIPVSLTDEEIENLEEISCGNDASQLNLTEGFYVAICFCHPERKPNKVIEIYNSGKSAAEYFRN